MLQIQNLSFSYDNSALLKELNFYLKAGEIYGLSGASGAGKSTLCRLISGEQSPTSGTVSLNLNNRNSVMDRKILVVHQEDDLFAWQKASAAIDFVKNPSADTNRMLEIVELSHAKNLYPRELSGGMKKRLSLARALSANPEVLILDETFSSQNEDLRNSLMARLKEYTRETKFILMIVSHDIAFLKQHCDSVLELKS